MGAACVGVQIQHGDACVGSADGHGQGAEGNASVNASAFLVFGQIAPQVGIEMGRIQRQGEAQLSAEILKQLEVAGHGDLVISAKLQTGQGADGLERPEIRGDLLRHIGTADAVGKRIGGKCVSAEASIGADLMEGQQITAVVVGDFDHLSAEPGQICLGVAAHEEGDAGDIGRDIFLAVG